MKNIKTIASNLIALAACFAGISLPIQVKALDLPEIDIGPELRTCYFAHNPVHDNNKMLRATDCLVERYNENGNKNWFVKTSEGAGIKFILYYDDSTAISTAKAWVIHDETGEEVLVHMNWGVDDEGDLMIWSDRHKVKGIPFEMYIDTSEDIPASQGSPAEGAEDEDFIGNSQIS